MSAQLFFLVYKLRELHPFLPSLIYYSGVYLPYVLVGGLAVYLFISGQYIFRKRLFITVASLVSAGIAFLASVFIRGVYSSPRPFVSLKIIIPLIDESKKAFQSFPSNHASVFFAIGTFLYFYHTRLGALYLIAAALISIARVAAGVHWPMDVFAGAALGVASAHLIKWLTKGIKKNL